jgi:hypothetical protein
MRPTIDDRDRALIAERLTALDVWEGPRVGDYVDFPGDIVRRISHIWRVEPVEQIQTSDPGGSFYLGHGFCSFSGSLYRSIPADTLTLTEETREGAVWMFHHNFWMADNGVYFSVPFRVYRSTATAPTY